MLKPSDVYINKYGYDEENVGLSDYQMTVKSAFETFFSRNDTLFEIHESSQLSRHGHFPTLVIFRPAQSEQEFDIDIEIGLDEKKHIFRWALDDNWDEEWNDTAAVNELHLSEMPNLSAHHDDKNIAYLLKATEYALSGNIKLYTTYRNDYAHIWEAKVSDGSEWKSLGSAHHPSFFNLFRKSVTVQVKALAVLKSSGIS